MELKEGEQIIKILKQNYKNFTVVGSIKRKEPVIEDVDILVKKKYIEKFLEKNNNIIEIISESKNKILAYNIIYNCYMDIFLCDDENYIFMKFMLESPKKYNIRVRKLAKLKGYKLSQYGFYKVVNGEYIKLPIKSISEIIEILGITKRSVYNRD